MDLDEVDVGRIGGIIIPDPADADRQSGMNFLQQGMSGIQLPCAAGPVEPGAEDDFMIERHAVMMRNACVPRNDN
ncbi:hypothetical protein [Sphingomonas sp. PvP055]|uniref:hypothetical protein n=1 Tax=Sphingomonas sp. PvP055 TaxID=3156391 RepID=UPI003399A13A